MIAHFTISWLLHELFSGHGYFTAIAKWLVQELDTHFNLSYGTLDAVMESFFAFLIASLFYYGIYHFIVRGFIWRKVIIGFFWKGLVLEFIKELRYFFKERTR